MNWLRISVKLIPYPKPMMLRATGIFLTLLLLGGYARAQTLAKIEAELLKHLDAIDKASNYGGSSDYEILEAENEALQNAFLKYGSRADVLSYSFPKLKKRIYLTTSRNGKLRAYSWDTNEGGTMHDFVTVFQFQGVGGKVNAWSEPYSQSMEDRGAGTFVNQIFQVDTGKQPIYLVVDTFIGSTSLAGQGIHAFRINGNKLDRMAKVIKTANGITDSISFEYDFFSVVDHPERPIRLFSYDETKRSFRFPVVIEDSKTPQGRVTNRYITYRFDGKYFMKVS
jgi:hypothetical protein